MSEEIRYTGMTLNERLFQAGLNAPFDSAVESQDRSEIVRILAEVDCEPTMKVEVSTPEHCLGDVIGVLNDRRLMINDCEMARSPEENIVIIAEGPLAATVGIEQELYGLADGPATVIMAITGYAAIEPEFDPDDTFPAAAALGRL